MAEKQEVQAALDGAAALADSLKSRLAQAEEAAGALQVRARRSIAARMAFCKGASGLGLAEGMTAKFSLGVHGAQPRGPS
jgi:hypothetical protein